MSEHELKKHTLFLRDGDFDFLTEKYRSSGLKASAIIRAQITKLVEHLRARDADGLSPEEMAQLEEEVYLDD